MWQYNYNNELYHFGTKGMKWKNHQYTTKQQNSSDRKNRLYAKYKAKGMSDSEAAKSARRRVATERIIIGAAAASVVACGAYLARKKMLKNKVSKLVKETQMPNSMNFSTSRPTINRSTVNYANTRFGSNPRQGVQNYTQSINRAGSTANRNQQQAYGNFMDAVNAMKKRK